MFNLWKGKRLSTILFSGRFSKVHTGHIITIQRLGEQYDLVIVCVLDYPECSKPLPFRMNVLNEALARSKGTYMVISNNFNFGKLGHLDWYELLELPPFDHYGSGNQEVLTNMGHVLAGTALAHIKIVDVPRYPGYTASKETS